MRPPAKTRNRALKLALVAAAKVTTQRTTVVRTVKSALGWLPVGHTKRK